MKTQTRNHCPRCVKPLLIAPSPGGVVYRCEKCGGLCVGLGYLKQKVEASLIQKIWLKARTDGLAGEKRCPTCPKKMLVVEVPLPNEKFEVDICPTCYHMWFDKSEMEKLPPTKQTASRQVPSLTPTTSDAAPWVTGSNSLDALDIAIEALTCFWS